MKCYFVLLIIHLFYCSNAMINFFISKSEMNRTLGLNAELNYIDNGQINSHSTRFPYRVNSNITQVVFSWNTKLLNKKVEYELKADAGDNAVLPVIFAPTKGFLPTKTETFVIEYRCAGNKAGRFGITLHINFSWPETNGTYLTVKQEKLCSSLTGRGGFNDEYVLFKLREGKKRKKMTYLNREHLLFMIFGCFAALLFVIFAFLFLYIRSPKKSSFNSSFVNNIQQRYLPQRSVDVGNQSRPLMQSDISLIRNSPKTCSPSSSQPSTSKATVIIERRRTIDYAAAIQDLYADLNLFQVHPENEMEGQFSEMKWAIWRQNQDNISGDIDDEEDKACEDEAVLAKTLKNYADRRQFERFLNDALVFYRIPPHPNLAQVLAVASHGKFDGTRLISGNLLVCYKHSGFGNLKKFLQKCRSNGEKSESEIIQTLRTHELVSMATQILRAICYLHKYGIIHKDIATRNCMVSEVGRGSDRLFVQLCDSALSRDFFPDDYAIIDDRDLIPVKWMAHESLVHNTFNSSTDIWSFGIMIWELSSCGQQPFQEINPKEMIKHLEETNRPSQQYNCPDELYSLMANCWQFDFTKRPNGEKLSNILQEFTIHLRRFI